MRKLLVGMFSVALLVAWTSSDRTPAASTANGQQSAQPTDGRMSTCWYYANGRIIYYKCRVDADVLP
jgi:hypothetical protein